MGSRTWIKVYCDKWLGGTLREESPDVRGVWIDLLTLAGSGQYGDTGEIKLTNGVGFTDKQISEILQIKVSIWRRARARFLQTDRIKISPRGAILIVNWSKYQSEYDRQKKYRQPKENTPTLELESPFTNPLENEKEIESKKLQPEVTTKGYNDWKSGKQTWKTRIAGYLQEHGPSKPTDIAAGLGLPEAKHYLVNMTLSQNKGRIFINPQRGIWALKDGD